MLLYLKNLFSNAERHALEKQVMQDPFDSEAFDGLSELSAEVFETDIKKLQSQINERTEKRKVWFWQQHYAIAASVLFLIGLGLTIAVWNTDNEPYQIVTNTQEVEDAVVVNESVINEEIEKEIEKEELFQEPEIDLNKQEETIVAYEEVDEEVLEERETKESIQEPEFSKIATSAPAKVAAAATDVIEDNVEEAAAVIESKTETGITNNESVVIEKWSGVILDNYGMPLSGVSVIVKGTDEGVVTDFDGNYSFEAPKNAKVEANYIGFEIAEISFENHKKVTLDEDLASLDEVVVVGYGTTKKKRTKGALGKVQANTSNIIVEEALSGRVAGVSVSSEENVSNALITKEAVAPQGNDAGFKQWVMTQLNPSKFEKDKEYNIDVTFVIDENGKVSTIEIPTDLKSSEKKHLKTIFESSPSWVPAQNKNGTIKESKSLVLWFHF